MTRLNRVFLVDQDASARCGLTRLLRQAGIDARDIESIEHLFDVLEPGSSACLVLDAGTPEMPGSELKVKLDARYGNVKIIVIAADDDSVTRRNAQSMEAAVLFRKPVDGAALLDAVNWALSDIDRAGPADSSSNEGQ